MFVVDGIWNLFVFNSNQCIVGRRRSRREVPEGMLLSVNVDPNFDVMIF